MPKSKIDEDRLKKFDPYPSHVYFNNKEDYKKAKKILDNHYFDYEPHSDINQLNIKNKLTIKSILRLFDLEGIRYNLGDNKISTGVDFFGLPFQD